MVLNSIGTVCSEPKSVRIEVDAQKKVDLRSEGIRNRSLFYISDTFIA